MHAAINATPPPACPARPPPGNPRRATQRQCPHQPPRAPGHNPHIRPVALQTGRQAQPGGGGSPASCPSPTEPFTYVPDIITLQSGGTVDGPSAGGVGSGVSGNDDDDGLPELDEIKNYSCYVTARSSKTHTTNQPRLLGGNTSERLKITVLGARARGHAAAGAYDHSTGTGRIPKVDGDYRDAIDNRKARVHLDIHDAITGGLHPYAARRLRRLGRAAAALGNDHTDYTKSYTASSFVPYYAQRISSSSVMHLAASIIKAIGGKRHARRLAAAAAPGAA